MKSGYWVNERFELAQCLAAVEGDERFVAMDHKDGDSLVELYFPDASNPRRAQRLAELDFELHRQIHSLSLHPNVLVIHGLDQVRTIRPTKAGPLTVLNDPGRPFLICQYRPGDSLQRLCDGPDGWRPDMPDFLKLADEIIAALISAVAVESQAHTGLNDVSWDNVWQCQGSAFVKTLDHMYRSTPAFQPPERRWGELNIDGAIDTQRAMVHSVCVLLYWVKTGKMPPWTEASNAEATKRLCRTWRPGDELEPGLRTVLQRGMHLDPKQRYATLEALRQALAGLAGEPAIAVPVGVQDTVSDLRFRDGSSVVFTEWRLWKVPRRVVRLDDRGAPVCEELRSHWLPPQIRRALGQQASPLVPSSAEGATQVLVSRARWSKLAGFWLRQHWGAEAVIDWPLPSGDRRSLEALVAEACQTTPLLYDYYLLSYAPGADRIDLRTVFPRGTLAGRSALAVIPLREAAAGQLHEVHVVKAPNGTLVGAVSVGSWQVVLKARDHKIVLRLDGHGRVALVGGTARPVAFDPDYFLRRLERQGMVDQMSSLAIMIDTTKDPHFEQRRQYLANELTELEAQAKQLNLANRIGRVALYECGDRSHTQSFAGDRPGGPACTVNVYPSLAEALRRVRAIQPTTPACPAVFWEEALPQAISFLNAGLGPGFLLALGSWPPHPLATMRPYPSGLAPSERDWRAQLGNASALGFGRACVEFPHEWENRGGPSNALDRRTLSYRDGWWHSDLWQACFAFGTAPGDVAQFILHSLSHVLLPEAMVQESSAGRGKLAA